MIIVIYLAATVLIGLLVNRLVDSMSDFVVAGRSLKTYVSIATMVGSELGLVTVMYAAQKGFTGGFAAFHIGVVAGVSTLLIGLTGFIVVPLREREVMTIPEFYGQRFGRSVRILGALLLAFGGILNMGLFLTAGAYFVTGLTGLNDPLYVNIVMSVLLILVLAYTVLGGMVSVVITDYIQFVFLSFGMLLACWLAVDHLGWDRIVNTVAEVHGERGFDPFDEQGFGVEYVIWMIFTAGIVSCAVWQTAVMRACAAESTQVVKRLYIWSSLGFMIRFMIPQFLGICALAFFWHDDMGRTFFFDAEGGVVADSTVTLKAMPIFLAQILPIGLIGLIGAAMLAAFMSTHDSYLLCWASVIANDIFAPLLGERFTDQKRVFTARILIVVIGLFLLIWGLWFPLGQDLWDYMAITGAIYFTGAFSLLLCGLYWKRASSVGAILALSVGTLNLFGLKPVQQMFDLNYESQTVGLWTTVLAIVAMIVGSLLFPDSSHENDVQREPTSEGEGK